MLPGDVQESGYRARSPPGTHREPTRNPPGPALSRAATPDPRRPLREPEPVPMATARLRARGRSRQPPPRSAPSAPARFPRQPRPGTPGLTLPAGGDTQGWGAPQPCSSLALPILRPCSRTSGQVTRTLPQPAGQGRDPAAPGCRWARAGVGLERAGQGRCGAGRGGHSAGRGGHAAGRTGLG